VSANFSIPLPIFDRNQGEIARTRFALTQSQENAEAALTGTDGRSQNYKSLDEPEIVTLSQWYLKKAQTHAHQ